jgi:phosphoribosylanthranilate isomerase
MTFVKICGLRTIAHAVAAVEAGADLLGFIFAPARRQISPATAAQISQAVRSASPAGRRLTLVGVFVNEEPAQMRAIAAECGLDAIQLSGDEPAAIAEQLSDIALIKAIRFEATPTEDVWLQSERPNVRLHVDAHVPGAYGGAGVTADWDRARLLARQRPIVLAGGLTPENVGAAIEQVRPWGVDVSSGVETDGAKDVAKIHAFVTAARAADRRLGQQ